MTQLHVGLQRKVIDGHVLADFTFDRLVNAAATAMFDIALSTIIPLVALLALFANFGQSLRSMCHSVLLQQRTMSKSFGAHIANPGTGFAVQGLHVGSQLERSGQCAIALLTLERFPLLLQMAINMLLQQIFLHESVSANVAFERALRSRGMHPPFVVTQAGAFGESPPTVFTLEGIRLNVNTEAVLVQPRPSAEGTLTAEHFDGLKFMVLSAVLFQQLESFEHFVTHGAGQGENPVDDFLFFGNGFRGPFASAYH